MNATWTKVSMGTKLLNNGWYGYFSIDYVNLNGSQLDKSYSKIELLKLSAGMDPHAHEWASNIHHENGIFYKFECG